MTECSVIYYYSNKLNNKSYVGQTINLGRRKQQHIKNYSNHYFDVAYSKCPDNFEFDCFECDECLLDFMEQYCIAWFQSKAPSGYNLTDGGKGIRGYNLSDEHKDKISKGNKGKRLGFEMSEEQKEKISESLKGRTPWNKGKQMSEESKIKMSNSSKGKLHTEESKKKIGISNKLYWQTHTHPNEGIHLSEKTKQKISNKNSKKVVCDNLYLIFDSINDAAEFADVSPTCVGACCNGRQKTAGGLSFYFL